KINLGTKLVELMIEHTKMIKTPLVRRGRKALVHEMQFESGILEWYNEFNAADAVTRPMWLPLTQKPRPWADVVGGAYSDRLHPRRLLTKPFAGQMEKLRGQDLTAVYTAVNGLQETPWRINKRVLAVLQEAW